jgi:hypothetical protein
MQVDMIVYTYGVPSLGADQAAKGGCQGLLNFSAGSSPCHYNANHPSAIKAWCCAMQLHFAKRRCWQGVLKVNAFGQAPTACHVLPQAGT